MYCHDHGPAGAGRRRRFCVRHDGREDGGLQRNGHRDDHVRKDQDHYGDRDEAFDLNFDKNDQHRVCLRTVLLYLANFIFELAPCTSVEIDDVFLKIALDKVFVCDCHA